MSSNPTPGHPVLSHHGRIDLGPAGDGDLTSIKPEKVEEDTLMDVSNNGESETMEDQKMFQVSHTQPKKEEEMKDGAQSFPGDEIGSTLGDWEFSISNISENGVIPEGESDLLPLPPPGQGEPRCQLQATIKLPSKDFCLNRALPHLNLVMELEGEEVHVIKIELHQFLGSLPNPQQPPEEVSSEATFSPVLVPPPLTTPTPPSNSIGNEEQDQIVMIDLHNSLQSMSHPQLENASDEEAEGTEDDIVDISKPSPFSHQLTPTHSSPNGSDAQVPIHLEVSPQKKLGPRTHHSAPRIKKKVTRTGIKVKSRVVRPHRSTKDKAGWRHSCYFCQTRFQFQSALRLHILVHTGEKHYSCDKCGRQFNHKCTLERHQRSHDPATRHPFPCEECGQTFTRKESLTRHVNIVHRRLKEFGCPECDRKFGTKSDMMVHLQNIHFRIRHPCPKPNCGKSFADKSTLLRHQKTAHPKTYRSNHVQMDERRTKHENMATE